MSATFHAYFSMLAERGWHIVYASTIFFALEMVLPMDRHSMKSRLRAALFWAVYLAITAAALTAFNMLWSRLGIVPLFSLDFATWPNSPSLPVKIAGWIAVPVISTILGEFFYYWFHRLQHTPLMWRFHKVHHSLREMNAWNSNHHFTEEILRIPFIVIPMSLLFRVEFGVIPALVWVIIGLQGQYEHSSVKLHLGWLNRIIADNRYHRIHHSIERRHYNCNFGSFTSVWDIVFRTAYFPKKDEWPATGIVGVAEPKTLKEFLLMPFTADKPFDEPAPEGADRQRRDEPALTPGVAMAATDKSQA